VSVSTSIDNYTADGLTDGIIRIADMGEWACEGVKMAWGHIRLPWVQLDWDRPRSINRIILYDRPSEEEHTAGGRLKFSDGTQIAVTTIPNNGDPKQITFPPKVVEWVRFEVTDGEGFNLGLSEIEVFAAPEDSDDSIFWVNPFAESAKGRYFFFTPVASPMGMVVAAPITRN